MKFKNIFLGLFFCILIYVFSALHYKTFLPDNSFLFGITTFVYLLAGTVYLIYWIFGLENITFLASSIGWGGFLTNILAFIIRWIQTHKAGFGYIPLSNLYESLVFFGGCITGIYLFWELRLTKKILGSIVFLLASFVMAFATLKVSSSIQPLIPALKSNWLVAHVITCFLGYGAFAVGFAASIIYLCSDIFNMQKIFPDKKTLDNFIYKITLFGFFWLSLGIITGAVWADQAWGSYWSWDPKETWSFITWLVYGSIIHMRLTKGWSGKRLSWMNIIGFICVLFTYFGVNFLLSGLHSYATLD
ncbi:MAG: c-type cytochrome biogenesis protein CcsB [Thermodesulfobacteriota bacterium]|nr:MAG: c-type cytochrome biogenesis protein CcsB [Thermodesulfobacteriota bacterium]RLG13081.1 MAG: c-type cytochrome biogenesis protein CcsB [Candidatus Pacearchaeota archaeon]